MRRKLTVTEELNRMIGLMIYENGDYKNPIIKEDEDVTETEVESGSKSFVEKIDFAPGWYTLKDNQNGVEWDIPERLSEELLSTKQFLINNPTGYIVNVIIEAGESRIPNTDNTTEGGGKRVEPKYLSKKREETIKNYIQSVFDTWKEEGILKTEPLIDVKEPIIGETPWVGQKFCPDDEKREKDPEGYLCTKKYKEGRDGIYSKLRDKYTDEQYVKVTIKITKKIEEPEPKEEPESDIPFTPECVTGLEIKIETGKHGCNNAEFFLFANNTLIKNVEGGDTHNGSNNKSIKRVKNKPLHPMALNPGYGKLHTKRYGTSGDFGKERSDIFKITNEQSKEITKENENGVINLFLICVTDYCHTTIQNVTITHPKKGEVFKGSIKANNSFLISLSPCGDEVVSDKLKEGIKIPKDIQSVKDKWFNERRDLSKTYFKLEKDKNPNIEYQEDYKGMILEKLSTLSNNTKTLLDLIKEAVKKAKEEKKQNISEDYETKIKELYQKIKDVIKQSSPDFTLEQSNDKNSFTLPNGEKYNFVNKFLRNNELASDIRTQYPELLGVLNQVFTLGPKSGSLQISKIKNYFTKPDKYSIDEIKYPDEVSNLSDEDESVEI